METEEEGLGQASGPFPAICTSPLPQPHDRPPLTCRSFSAVGLFLGFLVKANLRKWWKFWVLVGTRVPQFLRQVSRRAWARPEVPPCKERGGLQGFPHNGPPSQLPAFFPSHSALSKGPSGEASGIPGPVEAIPRTWPKGGLSPVCLVSQLGRLETAFGHEHQGPVRSTRPEVKGHQRSLGDQARGGGLSTQLTSWGAGGRGGAGARPARWQ